MNLTPQKSLEFKVCKDHKERHLCCLLYNSFRPHGQQHASPLCPSTSPKVRPSLCPLHQWRHPAISSSDTLFSFRPQSFPASGTLHDGNSINTEEGMSPPYLSRTGSFSFFPLIPAVLEMGETSELNWSKFIISETR